MLSLLPESAGENVGIRASGTVGADDVEAVRPAVRDAISAHERINLLVEVQGIEGSGLVSLIKELQEEYRSVERAAIVGDKPSYERNVNLFGRFMRPRPKYFDVADRSAAWNYVTGSR